MMTAFFFTLGIAISFLQWQGICMDDNESTKQFVEQSERVGWNASKKMLYRQEIIAFGVTAAFLFLAAILFTSPVGKMICFALSFSLPFRLDRYIQSVRSAKTVQEFIAASKPRKQAEWAQFLATSFLTVTPLFL
jgi:hypothetical protein